MPSRNADTSCSPVLNKISEHEPADEPPSDPARSGIDSHLFAILRKNYDISKFSGSFITHELLQYRLLRTLTAQIRRP